MPTHRVHGFVSDHVAAIFTGPTRDAVITDTVEELRATPPGLLAPGVLDPTLQLAVGCKSSPTKRRTMLSRDLISRGWSRGSHASNGS
ncbi:hypothetical protein WMF28_24660 [Sorangium sp. So ce590]|uniref:hypothetical protein n=1 Tax=Sorangium sp. So ce590 TaxID=3133317 RepID=UPI003F61B9A0